MCEMREYHMHTMHMFLNATEEDYYCSLNVWQIIILL